MNGAFICLECIQAPDEVLHRLRRIPMPSSSNMCRLLPWRRGCPTSASSRHPESSAWQPNSQLSERLVSPVECSPCLEPSFCVRPSELVPVCLTPCVPYLCALSVYLSQAVPVPLFVDSPTPCLTCVAYLFSTSGAEFTTYSPQGRKSQLHKRGLNDLPTRSL